MCGVNHYCLVIIDDLLEYQQMLDLSAYYR